MSIVRITCPGCSLSRELPAEKIPDRPVQVTCPRCKKSFSFSKSLGGETAPEPPGRASAAVLAGQSTAAAPPPVRAAARQAGKDGAPLVRPGLLGALLLLLAVAGVYLLRDHIPFPRTGGDTAKGRQVITIPPPSGPPPAAPQPASIPVQPAPAMPPTDSAATPATPTTSPAGKRFVPFDIYVFIYAVNAPGKVRVNGQDFKEIKDEPDMQYSINAFGDPFRFGSNTIDFELAPQKGGNRSFPAEVRMTVSRTVGSERKSIGEWRLSDKDGWKRSVALDIPEVTTP